jgi:putative RNA 2'-phosphotransferase
MADPDQSTSKFLSLILRHEPQTIGLTLDENGWANIQELLEKSAGHHKQLSLEQLQRIVAERDKKRFVISEDGLRIRANQGHSIKVDLQLKEATPPSRLFHGTATRNLDSIKAKGILKGERHHVHLSENKETAMKVGQRYGIPVIITVNAKQMFEQGYQFFISENGVWLTDWVPPDFLEIYS